MQSKKTKKWNRNFNEKLPKLSKWKNNWMTCSKKSKPRRTFRVWLRRTQKLRSWTMSWAFKEVWTRIESNCSKSWTRSRSKFARSRTNWDKRRVISNTRSSRTNQCKTSTLANRLSWMSLIRNFSRAGRPCLHWKSRRSSCRLSRRPGSSSWIRSCSLISASLLCPHSRTLLKSMPSNMCSLWSCWICVEVIYKTFWQRCKNSWHWKLKSLINWGLNSFCRASKWMTPS